MDRSTDCSLNESALTESVRNKAPRSTKIAFDHRASSGAYFVGDSASLLRSDQFAVLRNKVQLILTSPPYPLNRKKRYGNLAGDEYLNWFESMAPLFSELLTEDGSIVIELGNAWEPHRPVQSLLHLKALLAFAEHPRAGLRLCQQFVCYNPSRLPSPAQWVNVERTRVVDSYTHVWWLAKSDNPKADNRRVLRPYSESMKSLLRRGSYNSGKRPSEHHISKNAFLRRHKGSIAHNFFELESMSPLTPVRLPNAFRLSNTSSNDYFARMCRAKKIVPHPARMPEGLAAFFVKFLTDKGDLVVDPFAGSNTTGFVAQLMGRDWVSIEANQKYSAQSKIRLSDPRLSGRKHGST